MNSLIKSCCFSTLVCLFINVNATDYYVSPSGANTNSGAQSVPFKTISKAVTLIQAGDRVFVAAGTYAENIYTTVDGTAAKPIRFVSDTAHRAKIIPPANSARKIAFDNRGDYVTIYGFEVDGTLRQSGTVWTVGINVAGTGDSVVHCLIHDIYNKSTDIGNGSGGAGILLDSWYGFNNMWAFNNVTHHIGPASSTGNWYHGIYQTATGAIKNNLTYAIAGGGIHMWHDANHIVIANNTSFGNRHGFLFGGGDFVNTTGPADYCTFANNIAFDNTDIGFDQEGQYGTHNIWTNNLSFQNGRNWRLNGNPPHTADVTANPQFVNYIKTGGGDYHLKSTSPAINKGVALYASTRDFDGTLRTQGGAPDIGAYEYAPTSMTEALSLSQAPVSLVAQPNPFHGVLQIRLNGAANQDASVLTVFDVRGKAVHQAKFKDGRVSWNAEGLPAGAYLVRVRTASGRIFETRSFCLK